MITDDEVMRVLEQANPVSVDDPIPMLDIAGYRDVLDARNTTMILIDSEPTPIRPSSGRRWLILVAAAAAVAAIPLVVNRDGDGKPADEPSPTVTVPPTAPPQALPNDFAPLAPGTYYIDEVSGTPTPRIFATIGAGWWDCEQCGGWHLLKRGADPDFDKMTMDEKHQLEIGTMGFSQPAAVFSDACHWEDGYYAGSVATLDGLVTALSEQQGWAEITAPSDITVDGYAGKAFQRTAPADMSDCDKMPSYGPRVRRGSAPYPFTVSWTSSVSDTDLFSGSGPTEPGQTETLWVIDLDGTLVVIRTAPWPEPSAGAPADFAADVLDSIRIEQA